MEKVYHVLYADEIRLNSIDAQLNGKVPLSLQEDETKSITDTTSGEGGLPPLAKGSIGTSNTEGAVQSIAYSFRDARFFDILDQLNLNIAEAGQHSAIVPDGDIHVLSGTLKVSSMSAGKPIIEMFDTFMKVIARNPALFGMDNIGLKNAKAANTFISAIKQIPAPSSFMLTTVEGKRVFGPLLEQALRIPLIDQILVFGNNMPFEWSVVGYVYPNLPNTEGDSQSFLFSMTDAVSSLRQFILPQCDAIMIPLLILR